MIFLTEMCYKNEFYEIPIIFFEKQLPTHQWGTDSKVSKIIDLKWIFYVIILKTQYFEKVLFSSKSNDFSLDDFTLILFQQS